jgi:hypothetical protein
LNPNQEVKSDAPLFSRSPKADGESRAGLTSQ